VNLLEKSTLPLKMKYINKAKTKKIAAANPTL
jgi:hypothetical protein